MPASRLLSSGLALAAATSVASEPLRAQAPAHATLRGVVVAAESGERIAYAVVVLEPGFSQRFADDSGSFVFTDVAAGAHRLLVRQVGYSPFDTVLQVSPSTPALRLELRHLPVELTAMNVGAAGECLAPGPPDSTSDPRLAGLFYQLRVNAERYRLLVDAYPFRYHVRRQLTAYQRAGAEITSNSILEMRSDDRWHYAPGKVVTDDPDESGVRIMHLPILPDLADSAFQSNHCFRLAGIDSVEGRPYVRVEFKAARGLRSQDIDGAVFMDPETYNVRHTTVSLTRLERYMTSLVANSVFKEIAPNIWVIDRVSAMTTLDPRPTRGALIGRTEEQKLMDVEFLRPLPTARDSTRRP